MDYSILMSVYHKEKPEYLRESMESIYNQTVPTDNFVLVCDGPLNPPLDEVIAEIRPENKKSRRVAERLGMTISGSFVKTYKGKEMPHLIYVLKKPQKSGRNGAGNV